MPKKRVKVSLKTQLERAKRRGRKEGMADILALLSAADDGFIPEYSTSLDDDYKSEDSCYFRARLSAAMLNAAKQNETELVLILVEAGADIDSLNEQGYTALHIAVQKRHTALIKALLKAGADPDHNCEETGGREYVTRLACAVEQDDVVIVKALLAAGADVHNCRYPGEGGDWLINYYGEADPVEMTRTLLKAGAYVGPDENGNNRTPLMSAARNGKAKSVALLIKAGSDVQAQDDCGITVLMKAAKGGKEGALDTIRLLLKSGAQINAKDEDGRTALMSAAEAGRLEAVRLLMSAGADVFSKAKARKSRWQKPARKSGNAFDVADDDPVKELIKSEMHRRIAAALSVLHGLPLEVRQKTIQLYLVEPDLAESSTDSDSNTDDSE